MVAQANTTEWDINREIVLTRVIDAPRDLVFLAWTQEEHLTKWFGPSGFTIENIACDVRVGGMWRFVMVAPDGTRFDNRMIFREIQPPELIWVDHGRDVDDDPGRFQMRVTFDEQQNGKTVVTLRQLHPTKEQRAAGIGFGAVEMGLQTLDKLAAHARALRSAGKK